MKYLNRLYMSVFGPAPSHELAVSELEEARRELLRSQTHMEYYGAQVDYLETRIARLDKYIKGHK
jgi:hypothetical protein